jgi:hypothetical protein
MDVALFRRAVNELISLGIKGIGISFNGESTLHPQLSEAIDYVISRGGEVSLTTNAVELDEDQLQALSRCRLISISMHRPELSLPAAKRLREIRGEHSLPILRATWLYTGQSREEIEKTLAQWRQHADVARLKGITSQDLSHKIFPAWGRTETVKRTHCPYPPRYAAILWNGDVTICCNDWWGQLVVGDMSRQGLLKVLQGAARARRLSENQQLGHPDHELCKTCSSWQHYTGLKEG